MIEDIEWREVEVPVNPQLTGVVKIERQLWANDGYVWFKVPIKTIASKEKSDG